VLSHIFDPVGRLVVFDTGSHLHLALGRPNLLDHRDAILATVADPDFHEPDPWWGRERFYRRHFDSRRWLRVVVDFGEEPAWVVTAFIQSHDPRR
jgi:hypothetical protein